MHTKTKRHNNHSNFDLYGDVAKIKAAINETTKDVKGKTAEILTHSVDDIKDKTNAITTSITNYVAEKPFKSLGIAFVSGLALGYLLLRKKQRP